MTRKEALSSILHRAECAGWAGADPYDGLHSTVGRLAIPFGPPARLLVIQSSLRFPGMREILGTRDSVNPKGLALFLGAVVRGRSVLGADNAGRLARTLIQELNVRARDVAGGKAWGYPFPWQSRFFYAPPGTPNAIATATAGWHLFEASRVFGDATARRLAEGAAGFLQSGLQWTDERDGAASISYTPLDRTRIVNVSGLAARLLARLGLREKAERLASYILRSQLDNGCWPYAPDRRGRWEDSFHTGFLLESLLHLRREGVDIPSEPLRRGFVAYERFFDPDGGARLYAKSTSAYDAHSAAQGIVTFAAAAEEAPDLAPEDPAARVEQIADWAMRVLWISDRERFAYRVRDGVRDERDFIRWVQAWMALGLASAEALHAARRPSAGAEAQGMGVEVA